MRMSERVKRIVKKQFEMIGRYARRFDCRVAKFIPMVEHELPLGIVIPQFGLEPGPDGTHSAKRTPQCRKRLASGDCAVR